MEKFSKKVMTDDKVIYIFTAPTCGQCKMVKPALEKMASTSNVRMVEVDTSTESGLSFAQNNGVRVLPSALICKGASSIVLSGAGQVSAGIKKHLTE